MTKITFWVIADTHLSFAKAKDMNRFGERWVNHTERLANHWRALVQPQDVVLIPGDVSWAQKPKDIAPDLHWLASLPGQKVLARGNHDHWWKDIETAREIAEPLGFLALDGNSTLLHNVILCGAMGHLAPHDPYYKSDPKKDRYTRELGRLEAALQSATELRTANQPIIAMLHYPPFTSDGKPTGYIDILSRFKPDFCVYGHLHGAKEWELALQGNHDGVEYVLAAADFLEMMPKKLLEIDAE
jgi:uncharacterized protein